MKTIKVSELKVGDVFCLEIKLHGRESFEVEEIFKGKNYIKVRSRNTFQSRKMELKPDKLIIKLS